MNNKGEYIKSVTMYDQVEDTRKSTAAYDLTKLLAADDLKKRAAVATLASN